MPVETPRPTSPQRAWHALSVAETAAALQTHPERGLGQDEATARLGQHGPNELKAAVDVPAWKRFLEQFADFIVLMLIGAALVSGFLGEWLDCIAIWAIVLLNAVVGFVQEYQAKKAIDALRRMTAPRARVVRDGQIEDIEARRIVPGDVVALDQGDIVPADCRLVAVQNLQTEEAALTGESVPVKKMAGDALPAETGLGDRLNTIFASTRVTYGRGRGIAVGTGMDTELGRIADLVAGVQEEKTPLQQRMDEMGHYLVYAALILVGVVFVVGLVQGLVFKIEGRNVTDMFLMSVSLAVAAVPEGLAAVVTIALALGLKRLARRRALIRRLPSVETLGATTVIASDKTGTLTQNQMTVRRVALPGRVVEVSGEGYGPVGGFAAGGAAVDPQADAELLELLRAGTIACKASLREESGRWTVIGDPTEGAILTAAAKAGLWRDRLMQTYTELAEIPFDSDRKRMSVLCRTPDGRIVLYVKGAPDVVLEQCTRRAESGREVALDPAGREAVHQANRALATQALRVLGIACRTLSAVPAEPTPELESDLTFLGLVGMIDPPRPEAVAAVRVAHEAGIRTVMITGDHADTAVAIAGELGMFHPGDRAVTGAELQAMGDDALAADVEKIRVYARVSPEHKLRIVRAWKARGQVVAMTGDGVNDAPALKESDIGIAMGITGTDVSKEAADMILADDNFATIVAAVEEGRAIFDNIRRFILFLLSCNVGEVLAMFVGVLLGMPLPLLPIQILWINLATDSLPALALGVEPAEPGIMKRPPRPAGEPIITRHALWIVVLQGAVIGAVTLGAFAIEYYWREPGALERARVMAFSASILAQCMHAFNLRSLRYSVFRLGLFTNPYLLGAAGVVGLSELAVIYLPFCQPIFKTMPLTAGDWAWVVGLGLLPLLVVEAGKALGLHGRESSRGQAVD